MNLPRISILSAASIIRNKVFSTQGNRISPSLYDYNCQIGLYPEIPLNKYVHKNRDIVNMSPSQKLLICATGAALDAIINLNTSLSDADICISCCIGERDEDVDAAVFANSCRINEELLKLRPNQLLVSLPNLFAANVSLIFGMTGESVTYFGDSLASINAIDRCFQLIEKSSDAIVVTGGVFNGDQAIYREFSELNKARGELKEMKFGVAASSLVFCGDDHRNSTSKIADLFQNGPVNIDNVASIIKDFNIRHVVAAHCYSETSSIYKMICTFDVTSINISTICGNIFEASLQTAIFFAVENRAQDGNTLVLCESIENIFYGYCIRYS